MSLRNLPVLTTAILLGLWMLAFTATHWPMPHQNANQLFPHADKVVHTTIYAILAIAAFTAARAWNFRWSTSLILTVIVALIGVGIFDELTQMLAIGRSTDSADLLADTFGACLGTGIYALTRGSYSADDFSPRKTR